MSAKSFEFSIANSCESGSTKVFESGDKIQSTALTYQRREGKKFSMLSIRFSKKMMIDSPDLIHAWYSWRKVESGCKYQIGAIYHHFSRKSNWNYRKLFPFSPLLRQSCTTNPFMVTMGNHILESSEIQPQVLSLDNCPKIRSGLSSCLL